MDKKESVVWQGGDKDNRGPIPNGADCVSMAQTPGEAGGLTAKTLEKHAAVTLTKVGDGYEITISVFRSAPKRPLSLVPTK